MSLKTKKLSFIERFMKINKEQSIVKLEALITKIEMNGLTDASVADIKRSKIRSFDDFSNEVKQWLNNKTNKYLLHRQRN